MFSLPALFIGMAIATVPLFSYTEGLTYIPQVFAALAAVISLRRLNPSYLHASMICYLALTAYFGLFLIAEPTGSEFYWTLLKVAGMCLICNLTVRSKADLGVVLFLFVIACPIAFAMNYNDIVRIADTVASQRRQYFTSGLGNARFDGTFSNANVAGLYATSVLLLTFSLIWGLRSRMKYLLMVLVVPPALIIGYYSGSKKALIAFVLICIALVMARGVRSGKSWGKLARTGMLALVLAGGISFVLLRFSAYGPRMMAAVSGAQDHSTGARLVMFNRAISMWLERPVFGQGWEAFRIHSGFLTYSHSTITEMLANGGIIAFGLWILLFFFLFRDLLRKLRMDVTSNDRTFDFILLSYVALFVMFSTFAVMYYDRSFMPLLACIGGYIKGSSLLMINNPEIHMDVPGSLETSYQ